MCKGASPPHPAADMRPAQPLAALARALRCASGRTASQRPRQSWRSTDLRLVDHQCGRPTRVATTRAPRSYTYKYALCPTVHAFTSYPAPPGRRRRIPPIFGGPAPQARARAGAGAGASTEMESDCHHTSSSPMSSPRLPARAGLAPNPALPKGRLLRNSYEILVRRPAGPPWRAPLKGTLLRPSHRRPLPAILRRRSPHRRNAPLDCHQGRPTLPDVLTASWPAACAAAARAWRDT